MRTAPLLQYVAVSLALTLGLPHLQAVNVTLNTSDTGSGTSFNAAGNWSNGAAPSAGNTYSVGSGLTIRTPSAAGSFSFAGDSLSLANGSSLAFKGTGSGSDVISGNLVFSGKGLIVNFTTTNYVLGGNMALNSGQNGTFRLDTGNAGFTVSSAISGAGRLTFSTNGASQFSTKITLNGLNNTYSGGTTLSAFANLDVQAEGALGTGNLTMNGGLLNFGATGTNFIGNSANFVIASGLVPNSINLGYTGTDVIGGLSLNGGSTFLSAGTYSATDLNRLYGSGLFSGSGTLSVVPETHSRVLLLLGLSSCLLMRRRRCSK